MAERRKVRVNIRANADLALQSLPAWVNHWELVTALAGLPDGEVAYPHVSTQPYRRGYSKTDQLSEDIILLCALICEATGKFLYDES